MKLVWSPDTALQAYISTVKSCGNIKESGVAEFLSAMAGGRDAKLIVECWAQGDPITTSMGLAIAARHTSGRHVCIVPDEASRSEYVKAMHVASSTGTVHVAGPDRTEVVIGEDVEKVMVGLAGVDFLVVDCKRRDFVRVLRFARLSNKGAVLVCKNAFKRSASAFRWKWVLDRETPVIGSTFLPVGQGLDIAYIGSRTAVPGPKRIPSRWVRHVDPKSGEEHVFRR